MKQSILVIGATGTVGSEIVKNLKNQGHDVREVTSQQPKTKDQVHINLLTGEGIAEAFKGMQKAFLLSPGGYLDQDKILIPLIEEAKKQKLEKVVLMSAMGANASDEGSLRKAEIALEKSGLNYNILRPNWFQQNFHTFWMHDIMTHGKILLPAGEAKVSFIDARDIALAATTLLLEDRLKNQAFDITGPEAIDHTQAARALSEVSGKNITYQEITPAEFKKNMTALGVSAGYADFLNLILGFLKQGYSAAVTDSFEKITGQKPSGFAKYAKDYKQRWA